MTTNRVVIFSDLHLHPWAFGSRVNEWGYNSRMWAMANAVHEMIQYCDANQIDTVFFCGDLFHTHGKVDTGALLLASRIFEHFKQAGIHVVVLRGNHDTASARGYNIHSLKWLDAYDNVIVVEKNHTHVNFKGINFAALAYTEDAEEIRHFLNVKVKDQDLVLMHQGVAGVPMASGWVLDEVLTPSMIPENIKHCFIGHYHEHKRVTDKITVVGSMTHQTWADVDATRGFIDYNLETNEIIQIKSNAPEFCRIDFGGDSVLEDDFQHQGPGGFKNKMINAKNFQGDPDDVRDKLLSWGALAVTFELSDKTSNNGKSLIHYTGDFSVQPILDEYEKSISNQRTLEIGKEIREESYEVPELHS